MNTRKTLKYIRIFAYILLIIFLIMLKYLDNMHWTCYINENFGILCPTCGITRATKAILNFDFILALKNNAYYTLILLPIFAILLIDDIICMITKKKSFVEIILGE